MIDIDKWQEIFQTIMKHKLRTFLTALGVFWGIFMLVLLMGAGKGLENGVMGLFGKMAKNSMFIGGSRTSKPYKGLNAGRFIRMKMDDIDALKSNFSDKIKHIAPVLWMPSGEVSRKDKKGAFGTRGQSPDYIKIDQMEMTVGRFINSFDMREKRKVAVIGNRVREVLFEKEEEPLGEYVKFQGVEYKVIGVFKSNRRGQESVEDEEQIYVPITTAQKIMNRPSRVNMIVCSMYDDVSATALEPHMMGMLRERHSVHPEDEQGFWVNNMEEQFGEVMGLFNGISFLVWFVGIGSILAGVIGVGNIMLIIVKERTKEIGVRKAMGATPGSIISMILQESIFITTIAGYLGLMVSTGIIVLMNMALGEEGLEFYANPEVDIEIGIIALIILIIAGALTGLIPAFQAANINPVDALKDE